MVSSFLHEISFLHEMIYEKEKRDSFLHEMVYEKEKREIKAC